MPLSLNGKALSRCSSVLFVLIFWGRFRHNILIGWGSFFGAGISPIYGVVLSLIFLFAAAFTGKALLCYIAAAFQVLDIVLGLENRFWYGNGSIYDGPLALFNIPIPDLLIEVVTWGLQLGFIISMALAGTNSFMALLQKEQPQEGEVSNTV